MNTKATKNLFVVFVSSREISREPQRRRLDHLANTSRILCNWE